MNILLWVSLITGGLLFLFLILSLISGLDIDLDVDVDDFDADSGGLGVIKSVLTFVSISTYIIRIMLIGSTNPILAIIIGITCGGITVFLLSLFLKFLLSQQSNVNWSIEDALYKNGKVYLKIPMDGEGIIYVEINGIERQFKAKTNDYSDIETGTDIQVEEIEGEYVIVTKA